MNKIFKEYFLDDPVFKLVAIQKSINKIFKKTISKKSIFKVGSKFQIYQKNPQKIPTKKFEF